MHFFKVGCWGQVFVFIKIYCTRVCLRRTAPCGTPANGHSSLSSISQTLLLFLHLLQVHLAAVLCTISIHRRSTTGLIFFLFIFFFIYFFFFCIFTRLETLTICSCNYFTFKTFYINPQSTLVYGLLYRQGRKRGVLV